MAKRLLAGYRKWKSPGKDGGPEKSGLEITLLREAGADGAGYTADSYGVERESEAEVLGALRQFKNFPVGVDVDLDVRKSKNGAFAQVVGLAAIAAPAAVGRERAAG